MPDGALSFVHLNHPFIARNVWPPATKHQFVCGNVRNNPKFSSSFGEMNKMKKIVFIRVVSFIRSIDIGNKG